MKVVRQFTSNPFTASSYPLPNRETVKVMLNDLNEKIVSLQTNMKARSSSNLLPSLVVRSEKYCKLQGDPSSKVLLLPCCVTELQVHDSIFRLDVSLPPAWRMRRQLQGCCWRLIHVFFEHIVGVCGNRVDCN